jgi:succinate dehydrogenase / fumarate reductase cytochrome b subunit
MSSTAPSKRQRSTNSLPSGKGLLHWLKPILASSVGGKFLVALTGLMLSGFVVVHMLGNLQIFLGPDAINEYAHQLKNAGLLLWTARIALLIVFVVHLVLALRLQMSAREARPVPYAHEKTVQASYASRTMGYSGVMLLAFVLFHIAHYTVGVIQPLPVPAEKKKSDDAKKPDEPPPEISLLELTDNAGRHDVYRMMIVGFSNPLIAVLYIAAQLALMLHLSHGFASTFQSLGLNTPRLQATWTCLGWAITLLVGGGNLAIVGAVWAGILV